MGVDKQKKTPRTRDGNDNASSSHPAAFAQSPRKSSTVPMFYVLARSSKERRRGGGGNLAKFHLVRRVCVTRPFFLPLLFHSQFFVAHPPSPFWPLNREDRKRLLSNDSICIPNTRIPRGNRNRFLLFSEIQRETN